MYNQLRKYYGDYYLNTVLNVYNHQLNIIPVTYYRWDYVNSVYDDELLRNGSWSLFGNETSGMKWIQLENVPVSIVEQTTRNTNGVTYGVYSQNETSLVISYIGFKPSMFDFVLFSFKDNDDEVIYQISNLETLYKDTITDENYYRCGISSTGYSKDDILPKVINTYVFSEIYKKFYTVDDYRFITNSYFEANDLLAEINSKVIPNLKMRSI